MLDLEAKKLLPPNATNFEADIVSVVVNRVNRIYIDIKSLVDSKLKKTHKSLLPYVVEEFGFGSVSKYIPYTDEFMAEGIKWKKDRGSPASIFTALNWIFRSDDLLENTKAWHWSVVEIRLTNDIPNLSVVRDIVYLVRQSIPARTQLLRVWSGVDYPMMILNESNLNESRLNVPGGEWDDDLQLWLYINNKSDMVFPAVHIGLNNYTATLNNTNFKRSQPLNDEETLNSLDGALFSLTFPNFQNNNTTFGPFNLSLAGFISLNDDRDLADIQQHVGSY